MSDPSCRAGVVVLIDDTRSFADGRPCVVARTSARALGLLEAHRASRIDVLWLDHDLAGRRSSAHVDTTMPVVDELVRAARAGSAYDVGTVRVHTSNPAGAVAIRGALSAAGYNVVRHHDQRIWTHAPQQPV